MIAFALGYIYLAIRFPVAFYIPLIAIATVIALLIIGAFWRWFWGRVYPWAITLALVHLATFIWLRSLFWTIVLVELYFVVAAAIFLLKDTVIGFLKARLCLNIEFV